MHIDQRREGVDILGHFTRTLIAAGVTSREAAKRWRSDPANVRAMADLFRYEQQNGAPAIGALVGVDFSDELGLMKYNYTGAAHNTLHAYPEGWTPALRMCRGSAFDHDGTLVAHAFPKFFNRGEHPETLVLPRGVSWTASEKKDGHLGINFSRLRNWHVTTRGSFDSPSSKLGAAIMTREHLRTRWRTTVSPNITVLVEIIDPATKVHVDYGGQSGFVLIGAYDRVTLHDFTHDELTKLGTLLDIPVAERYAGDDLDALEAHMNDLTVRGREGVVARFDDLRVKLKFATYINLMVEAKLSPKYLMQRIVSGNLDRMIKNLDFEVLSRAHEMLGRIDRVRYMDADAKARARYLHGLVPPEECTAYYKDVCRAFLRHIGT